MRAFNFFIKAITFIPILTSLLYIAGLVRMQEFLKSFDIAYELYDASVDKIIMDGFLNVFILSTKPILASIYASIVLFIFMGAYSLISESKFFQGLLSKYLKKPKKKNDNIEQPDKNTIEEKMVHSAKILYYCMAVAIILLLFIAFITIMINIGQSDAIQLKEKINNNEKQQLCLMTEKEQSKAYILFCGNSFCGFQINNESVVIPASEIKSIKSDLKSCITKT